MTQYLSTYPAACLLPFLRHITLRLGEYSPSTPPHCGGKARDRHDPAGRGTGHPPPGRLLVLAAVLPHGLLVQAQREVCQWWGLRRTAGRRQRGLTWARRGVRLCAWLCACGGCGWVWVCALCVCLRCVSARVRQCGRMCICACVEGGRVPRQRQASFRQTPGGRYLACTACSRSARACTPSSCSRFTRAATCGERGRPASVTRIRDTAGWETHVIPRGRLNWLPGPNFGGGFCAQFDSGTRSPQRVLNRQQLFSKHSPAHSHVALRFHQSILHDVSLTDVCHTDSSHHGLLWQGALVWLSRLKIDQPRGGGGGVSECPGVVGQKLPKNGLFWTSSTFGAGSRGFF